jgi:hypothetical protein
METLRSGRPSLTSMCVYVTSFGPGDSIDRLLADSTFDSRFLSFRSLLVSKSLALTNASGNCASRWPPRLKSGKGVDVAAMIRRSELMPTSHRLARSRAASSARSGEVSRHLLRFIGRVWGLKHRARVNRCGDRPSPSGAVDDSGRSMRRLLRMVGIGLFEKVNGASRIAQLATQ